MEPCPQDAVCRRLARLTLGRVQPPHSVPPGATCGECAGPLLPTLPCFKGGVFPAADAADAADDLLCLPCALQCAQTFTDTFHTSVFSGMVTEDGSALQVVFAFDSFDAVEVMHGVPVQGDPTQERLQMAAEIMKNILRDIAAHSSDANDSGNDGDGNGNGDSDDSSYGTDDDDDDLGEGANDSDGLESVVDDNDIEDADNEEGLLHLDGTTLAQRSADALDHGVWSFPFNLHRQDVYCDRCHTVNPKMGVLALPDDNFDLCLACAVAVAAP